MEAAPVDDVAQAIADESALPGASVTDINAMIAEEEAKSPGITDQLISYSVDPVTTPAECAPLAPTAVSVIALAAQNPGTVAAREITSTETGGTTSVVLSKDPALLIFPADLTPCGTFERTSGEFNATYSASSLPLEVPGAKETSAASVVVENANNEISGAPGGTSRIARVAMGNVAFLVSGDENVPEEDFLTVVRAQAEKISR